jgi:hypothetical protein
MAILCNWLALVATDTILHVRSQSGTPTVRLDCLTGVSAALNSELAGCQFQDARLGQRFRELVGQLARKMGQSIPLACQDWTKTKAAYRFLSNR